MARLTPEQLEVALDIPVPDSDCWQIDDSRRLTGPGLLWKSKGAVIDVFDGKIAFDHQALVDAWRVEARRVLDAVGLHGERITDRIFKASLDQSAPAGVNLALSAPSDLLYSALFIAETALHFAAHRVLDSQPHNFDAMIADLKRVMQDEANPALIQLETAAIERGIDILCDDDYISLGHGTGSQTWAVDSLPAPQDVDWDALHLVPVAMITGTNGKSTSVRLTAAIAEAAGVITGTTSTDYVKIGDDILDRGDYSGPGGARMVLRDKRLEMAILETARGGILRRGLPLYQAQAALVNNIASDHLGQYGVNRIEDLADAKFAVARTLSPTGTLVLNADDDLVIDCGLHAERRLCWFSLDAHNPQIVAALKNGAACCWLDDSGMIHYSDKGENRPVIKAADIPLTMGGAAEFNVRNAMGALCLSVANGIDDSAICAGLKNFRSEPDHNPGRCNEFHWDGAQVFVDYAHNAHSISAVCQALGATKARSRKLMISAAGDRSDQDIIDCVRATKALNPDRVAVVELEDYLRGRPKGSAPKLMTQELLNQGIAAANISQHDSPVEGSRALLDSAEKGDLILLLVLSQRDEIFHLLSN